MLQNKKQNAEANEASDKEEVIHMIGGVDCAQLHFEQVHFLRIRRNPECIFKIGRAVFRHGITVI